MYTQAGLLDIHERTHRSMQGVLEHCAGLPAADMAREAAHFSYPSIVLQVHHVLGAERYWMSVLRGELVIDDDASEYTTIAALQGLRARIAAQTVETLRALSEDDVNQVRSVTTYHGPADLVPALVLLRTQTHAYQHQGEIASMLRTLGHTFPSRLDFPLG